MRFLFHYTFLTIAGLSAIPDVVARAVPISELNCQGDICRSMRELSIKFNTRTNLFQGIYCSPISNLEPLSTQQLPNQVT